ncbi:hypothetical protein GLAREA_09481 [Glarea lozoyensis ATCC 20868]|uniref:Uncharacterized protein n=1 Tax=Glarea lozoyensis (strain ATCC 20868 / MF5171) TaxID=1116229 RepID=S3D8N5_GLAL2|nr:uncharacterized protein GLAREA_09481 [Glarea lozoyensis ATCC 20868]EPE28361.1 hypothetical protein GLAREA_09481 [Glarea lozoyensis ATCC 20868]
MFRDVAIIVVGNWSKDNDDDVLAPNLGPNDDPCSTWRVLVEDDKQLGPLVKEHYNKLREQVVECHHHLLMAVLNHRWRPKRTTRVLPDTWEETTFYYREVLEECSVEMAGNLMENNELMVEIDSLRDGLSRLLKNNLKLDRTGDMAGQGFYYRAFICTDIKNRDLPWDTSETDW